MKIPRCAPPWLMHIAQDLIKAGSENPGMANLSWISNWNVALHWIQQSTYCALSYRGNDEIDESMKKQILDAFSRGSHKNLVTIVHETHFSGICFFGGAPPDIHLATIDFEKWNQKKLQQG